MKNYTFDCGCSFPIVNEQNKYQDGLPSMYIPYDEIVTELNYGKQCPEVFSLMGTGNTKGVFQLESQLGQNWSKKLVPNSIEEVSALISLIRPGTLRAIVDGKSMTQHYIDRKHGVEEVKYFNDNLIDIFGPTYGVLCYQEQAMRVAVNLAGYNEQEADVLRKAIGKKKADLMASLKDSFLKGCERVGLVTKEEAEQLFAWIQESQRYSFNKSHAVSYGVVGYLTALAKVHFPLHFYCSWIIHARDKQQTQQEVRDLVSDAKLFDIDVNVPSLSTLDENHSDVCISNNSVYFGIRCIKQMGESITRKFLDQVAEKEQILGKKVADWRWLEFLVYICDNISSKAVNGLISAGVLAKYRVSRQRMLFDYHIFKKFTSREVENAKKILHKHENLSSLMEELLTLDSKNGISNSKRKKDFEDLRDSLNNPKFSLDDKPSWVLTQEKNLLGVAVTISKIDTVDTYITPNTTCKEFLQGKDGNCTLVGEVISTREYIIPQGTNKGNAMGFVTFEDNSGQIDCVAFTNTWEEWRDELQQGSLVAITGKRSSKGSFQIEKVFSI